jgi:sporulation protein YlmC with PRC-barrel domain
VAIITQPKKANKATSLIGMEVRGADGKGIGKIHDIVFDLTSDRVAYCVLRTGGALSLSQKLHAVPLRAFQAGPDDSYLTLQVDRAKFEQAAGFDPKEWPAVVNPAWGAEPFWQEHTPAPRTTPTLPQGEQEKAPNAPSPSQPQPEPEQ